MTAAIVYRIHNPDRLEKLMNNGSIVPLNQSKHNKVWD